MLSEGAVIAPPPLLASPWREGERNGSSGAPSVGDDARGGNDGLDVAVAAPGGDGERGGSAMGAHAAT